MWRSRSYKHGKPWSIWITERNLIVEGADGGRPISPVDEKYDPNSDERREYADAQTTNYAGHK